MLLSNQKKPERINQQKKELTIDEILTEKIPKRVNANIENQVKKLKGQVEEIQNRIAEFKKKNY